MPIEGSVTENPDKTKNCSITATKEVGDATLSAGAFVNNFSSTTQYGVAGATVGVAHATGHAASVTAQKIPSYGKQVTGATSVKVLDTGVHRVDVSAFATHTMPKDFTPSYRTFGGAADYQYKNQLTAGASVSRTPLFKQTDYSASTGINLHQTPTSSVNLGVGVNRTDTQFGKGNWEKRVFLGIKKTF